MDYRECLKHIKGPLGPKRLEYVGTLYEDLRAEGGPEDCVLASVLKGRFDARSSPLCVLGKKDAASVQQDFFEAVDFFGSDSLDGGCFADFFGIVSALFEEDDEFRLMTTSAFGLALDH